MMRGVLIAAALFIQFANGAVLIDQIAVVVDSAIIKDSDIDRDIRITQFLNQDRLSITPTERKKAAAKLIEQIFIRTEIRTGSYGFATVDQANQQLDALIKDRYRSAEAFQQALKKYELDEADLREQFRWQLTVLQFIDARFKPAVVISEADIDRYYAANTAALRKSSPKATVDGLKERARDILIDEQVNRIFFAWLDQHRKDSKIAFHEGGLT